MNTALTHAERVAAAVPGECKLVALLHDALEDKHVTWEQIDQALPGVEGTAVALLTRPETATYAKYIDYIVRAANSTSQVTRHAGQIARTVKIADLRDNLYGRPEGPPPESLRQRYEKALVQLGVHP